MKRIVYTLVIALTLLAAVGQTPPKEAFVFDIARRLGYTKPQPRVVLTEEKNEDTPNQFLSRPRETVRYVAEGADYASPVKMPSLKVLRPTVGDYILNTIVYCIASGLSDNSTEMRAPSVIFAE